MAEPAEFYRAARPEVKTKTRPTGHPEARRSGNRVPSARSPARPRLSVVIPALDAAATIGPAIRSVPSGAEVIVVDGGSLDRTAEAAAKSGALVLVAPAGRASQLNRGARAASGRVLLFLHADCRLPEDAGPQMERILSAPGVVGGWFPQRIECRSALLRWGARGANLRARWLRLPYGDQAMFAVRTAFERVHGFPQEPIMEDAELARRLRRRGRLEPAASCVTTGSEHWERLGPLLTALLDYLTLAAWLLGVSPAQIAPVYRRLQRGRRPATRNR